jgi:hypothetical protein
MIQYITGAQSKIVLRYVVVFIISDTLIQEYGPDSTHTNIFQELAVGFQFNRLHSG